MVKRMTDGNVCAEVKGRKKTGKTQCICVLSMIELNPLELPFGRVIMLLNKIWVKIFTFIYAYSKAP